MQKASTGKQIIQTCAEPLNPPVTTSMGMGLINIYYSRKRMRIAAIKSCEHFDLISTCQLCSHHKTAKKANKLTVSPSITKPHFLRSLFLPKNGCYPVVLQLIIKPVIFVQANWTVGRLKITCVSKPHMRTCSLRLQNHTNKTLLSSTSSIAIYGDKNYEEP